MNPPDFTDEQREWIRTKVDLMAKLSIAFKHPGGWRMRIAQVIGGLIEPNREKADRWLTDPREDMYRQLGVSK